VLLDDPLSAVDSHVGQHIFSELFCGLLKQRTRVMVTNQLQASAASALESARVVMCAGTMQYLPHATQIVVMRDGRVAETGS
jgi:ABC-type multidrug transport system fused ATPase/permease subunit